LLLLLLPPPPPLLLLLRVLQPPSAAPFAPIPAVIARNVGRHHGIGRQVRYSQEGKQLIRWCAQRSIKHTLRWGVMSRDNLQF
jgi:hypothetical protein